MGIKNKFIFNKVNEFFIFYYIANEPSILIKCRC